MSNCIIHENHAHQHAPDCGHTSIEHNGHTDYLHNGHLHHLHLNHVDDHSLEVNDKNPEACTPTHSCGAHSVDHVHGPTCGHEPVPHGEHIDYLVDGHLHFAHETHCDDHGVVRII